MKKKKGREIFYQSLSANSFAYTLYVDKMIAQWNDL